MKEIFVPTDFSEASLKAVDYAAAFAKDFKGDLTFFKAYHPIPYVPEMYTYTGTEEWDKMRNDAWSQIKELYKQTHEKVGLKANYLVSEGLGAQEIVRQIETRKPFLTIMGTQGMSRLMRVIWGSVSLEVVRRSKLPVLVVPEGATYQPIRKIAYATNYHDSDIEAIRYLVKLAKPSNAEIVILHVADGMIEDKYEAGYLSDLSKEVRAKVSYENIRSCWKKTATLLMHRGVCRRKRCRFGGRRKEGTFRFPESDHAEYHQENDLPHQTTAAGV